MSSGASQSQSNANILQPLQRFYTIRFNRHVLNDDEQKNRELKIHDINRSVPKIEREDEGEDLSSAILITGIRNRDWNFEDDLKALNQINLSNIKCQYVPSIQNTIKNRSANFNIDHQGYQYEEYDFDEQDFQWLSAFNQFRLEKNLPELDENIFEYVIQLFEQQCRSAIREMNSQDTIQCNVCYRIDDFDDLIQCIQCKTIVHKKCFGIDEYSNDWTCPSCEDNQTEHQCYICSQTEGALKTFGNNFDQWVHLSCAFWHSQFEFDENMTLTVKDSFEFDGRCHICSKTSGVKLQCSSKNCQERFHAKCALDAGYDMIIAENDEINSIYLLALCHRHTKKLDEFERRRRLNKSLEIKQKRYNQFSSYIDFDLIQQQTHLQPDILSSIHTYYILKRQSNNCRPLIDLSDEIFNEKCVDLSTVNRESRLEQTIDSKPDVLQFFSDKTCELKMNFFVKYCRFSRQRFLNYEQNHFCLLDVGKKRK